MRMVDLCEWHIRSMPKLTAPDVFLQALRSQWRSEQTTGMTHTQRYAGDALCVPVAQSWCWWGWGPDESGPGRGGGGESGGGTSSAVVLADEDALFNYTPVTPPQHLVKEVVHHGLCTLHR
jgi:hypothetical protein